MSIHYGQEKLQLALMELVGPGDIHARLAAALGQHIFHIDPAADLPESIQSTLAALKTDLLGGKEASEPVDIRQIVAGLSEHQAEQFARRIVHLYGAELSSA